MNIFEGARRITKLTAAIIVFSYIVFWGATYSPTVSTTYNIYIGKSPIQTDDGCPDNSQRAYKRKTTANKTEVDVNLCFLPDDISGLFIPYKFENESVWLDKAHSPDVNKYVNQISNAFIIPRDDEKKLDKQYRLQKFRGLGAIFGWMLLNLGILFLFAWAVGWIVRGFMGIPQGQDKKSSY